MIIASTTLVAAEISGLVKNQGETLNFELAGQKNWDYDLKRSKEKNQSKVQLFIKTSDQATLNKIKNIENPFVQSISVKAPVDGKWLVEFILKTKPL